MRMSAGEQAEFYASGGRILVRGVARDARQNNMTLGMRRAFVNSVRFEKKFF